MSWNDVRSGTQRLARTPYIDCGDHVDDARLHLDDVWVVEDFVRDAQVQLAREEGRAAAVVLAADLYEAVDRAGSAAASVFGLRDNRLEIVGERFEEMGGCLRGGGRETAL